MHLSRYFAIFTTIAILIMIPLIISSVWNANSTQTNEILTDYITAASKDALTVAVYEDGVVFNSVIKRHNSLKAFYDTIYGSFDADMTVGNQSKINSYIPCVVLVDNNGMYINYRGQTNNLGQYTTTPIYSFTKTYSINGNEYIINYHINDNMVIFSGNGNVLFEGSYDQLRAKFYDSDNLSIHKSDIDQLRQITATDRDGNEGLLFSNKNIYDIEKQETITQIVLEKTEYYINSLNQINNNRNNYFYTINISKSRGWAQYLKGPTVLTFIQGNQMRVANNKSMNIYALAGGELAKATQYYVTKETDASGESINYYHIKGCSHINSDAVETVYRKFYNMEDCVKYNAYPCPDCIR